MGFFFWYLIGFLLPASAAFALTIGGGIQTLPNPLGEGNNDFVALIKKLLDNVVTPLGGIVAVFFIIYAGFLFVTAGGNDKKREEAKWALLYAVIGTAVLIGAQAISTIITGTINSLK